MTAQGTPLPPALLVWQDGTAVEAQEPRRITAEEAFPWAVPPEDFRSQPFSYEYMRTEGIPGAAQACFFFGFVTLIFAYLLRKLLLRHLDKHPVSLHRKWWLQLATGAGYGAGLVLGTVVLIAASGGFLSGADWQPFSYIEPHATAAGTATMWLFFIFATLYEELVFRGILLVVLALGLFWAGRLALMALSPAERSRLSGWLWLVAGTAANIVVAVSFAYAHRFNPELSDLGLINIGLAGIVIGQLMWNQGTVLGAWTFHLMWNALLVTLGLPVSGIAIAPPAAGIGATGAVDGSFSGGSFGPEGSIFATVLLTLAFGWLLSQSVRAVLGRSINFRALLRGSHDAA